MASGLLLLLTAVTILHFCWCQGVDRTRLQGHMWRPGAWGNLRTSPRQPQPRPNPHHPSLSSSTQSLPRGVVEALPGVVAKVMERYDTAPASPRPSTEPPVIWFPRQEEECPEASGSGGGFSPFGLLALLVSAANLLSLLAGNANNNNNNNNDNNDNNINSNLAQAGNEINANVNPNVYTDIVMGAGRRRRRRRDETAGLCWPNPEEHITGEEAVGVVGVAILRSYLQATLAGSRGVCVARGVCLAHLEAAEWGGVVDSVAWGLREAHVDWVGQVSTEPSRATLLDAADNGRLGKSCIRLYPCPANVWAALTKPNALIHALVSFTGPGDEGTP